VQAAKVAPFAAGYEARSEKSAAGDFFPMYKGDRRTMRRFLIALTLVLLLAVSISIGVLVAGWPQWRTSLGL
jgi:hypothetical protein